MNRIKSCQAIFQNVQTSVVLSSDTAHFHLMDYVNKNFWYFAKNNYRQLHEQPLYCEHVTDALLRIFE